MSWRSAKALQVIKKLEEDESVFEQWVDATFPVMGNFLYSCGWNGRIVVRDEAGAVLHKIEPRNRALPAKELTLVRSGNKFRLQSSSTFEPDFGWATLFKSLEAQLKADGVRKGSLLDLVYSFDYFTTSEGDCPGLAKTVRKILGK